MASYEFPPDADMNDDLPLRIPLPAETRSLIEEAISQVDDVDSLSSRFGAQAIEAFYTDPNAPEPKVGGQGAA